MRSSSAADSIRNGLVAVTVGDDGSAARSRAAASGSREPAGSSTAATTATRTTTGRRRRIASSSAARSSPSRRPAAARSAVSSRSSPLRLADRADDGRRGPERDHGPGRAHDGRRAPRRRAVRPVRPRVHEPRPRPPRPLAPARCRRRTERSAAEGQFAVVERGLTEEAGHGEVPTPTFPAHGFVHARARRSSWTMSPSTSSSTAASWR